MNVKRKTKRTIIWLAVFLIGLSWGCSPNVKEQIESIAAKHDAALVSATVKLEQVERNLESDPPQIKEALSNTKGAKGDIVVAQSEAGKLRGIAAGKAEEVEKLRDSWVSVKQKQLAVGIGSVLAMLGVVIVLMRYGGMWGSLAAVPILGVILKRIGAFKSQP